MSDSTKNVLAALVAVAVVAGCVVVVRAYDAPASVIILGTVALLAGAFSVYFSTRGSGSKNR
jgi:hypothetical protein